MIVLPLRCTGFSILVLFSGASSDAELMVWRRALVVDESIAGPLSVPQFKAASKCQMLPAR
jgi:hypothetical protein